VQLFLRNKLIIAILTSVLFTGFAMHPFYLGIVHLKYNSKSQSIETSVKLFVNDFEEALKKTNNKPVDLINGKNKEELNKLIDSYLKTHLTCNVNGKAAVYTFIGYELEKDVAWIYIEYKNIKSIKTVDIECSLLYDHFKQQTNIIRAEVNGNEQNTKLNCPEKLAKFSF
jgi:hypothetical protein